MGREKAPPQRWCRVTGYQLAQSAPNPAPADPDLAAAGQDRAGSGPDPGLNAARMAVPPVAWP